MSHFLEILYMCITKSTSTLNSRKTWIFLMSKVITLETHYITQTE